MRWKVGLLTQYYDVVGYGEGRVRHYIHLSDVPVSQVTAAYSEADVIIMSIDVVMVGELSMCIWSDPGRWRDYEG